MHSRPNVLLLVLPLICWQNADADPLIHDEVEWLETMAVAAHQTDYSGTFVYQGGLGGRVQISHITHISDSTGEHERLEALNGSRRELVSNNNQVWLFLGDRKVKVSKQHGDKIFPALLPEQISSLKESYTITQSEGDRVAGFHAHVVVFQPKDNLRYIHKMWAHSESGLLLKAVVLDERDRVIEQYAFTQLTLGGKLDRSWIEPDSGVESEPIKNGVKPNIKPLESVKSGDWQVDALPVGFKKLTEVCRPMRVSNIPVTHLVFSDGLTGISVFIEDVAERDDINLGLSSQGSIQIYSKINGDKLITVVGEVPPRTVIQVADSVRYAGQ